MRRILIAAATLLLSVQIHAQNLTVLHMNDTHSHIDPQRSGEYIGRGGAIEQAALIDSVRTADGKRNVLLLHAGDFGQGTSYFTEMNGDIEIDVLNSLGFDVVCLGNHEFDNGIAELSRRLAKLKAQVVCANYDFSSTPLAGLVKPYVVISKGNRKIGVVGLLTDLSSVVSPQISALLKYQDPSEVAEKYGRQLKDDGCDLVIALTHTGYPVDCEVAANTRSIDVVVGGHTHTVLDEMTIVKNLDGKDVKVVTNGKWGVSIARMAIDFQQNRLTALYDSEYLPTAYLAYERTGERQIMEAPFKGKYVFKITEL